MGGSSSGAGDPFADGAQASHRPALATSVPSSLAGDGGMGYSWPGLGPARMPRPAEGWYRTAVVAEAGWPSVRRSRRRHGHTRRTSCAGSSVTLYTTMPAAVQTAAPGALSRGSAPHSWRGIQDNSAFAILRVWIQVNGSGTRRPGGSPSKWSQSRKESHSA